MSNYFDKPYFFGGAEVMKAEHNPKSCESNDRQYVCQNNVSETKLVFVERSSNLPSFTEEELRSEIWIQIKGFPLYYISNLGRIYSTSTHKMRKPQLSPSDRDNHNGCNITLCRYESIGDNVNQLVVYTKKYVELMREHFDIHRILSSGLSDCIGYVVHRNNNVMDNRLSNLILTPNLTLRKSVKTCDRINRRIEDNFDLSLSDKIDVKRYEMYVMTDIVREFILLVESGKYPETSILYKDNFFVLISYDDSSYNIVNYLSDEGHFQRVGRKGDYSDEYFDSYLFSYPGKDDLSKLDKLIDKIHLICSSRLERIKK